ncbi:MAG: DUF2158 domain-containing protein [Bacteroidota bacterium]
MAQKFKTGDVVKLKSGGPDMTVVRYIEPIDIMSAVYNEPPKEMGPAVMVQCTWFEKD